MTSFLNSSVKAKEELTRTFLENFKPNPNEEISSDLSKVFCKVCGKPKYILQWSPLCRKDRYMLVDNIGCDCMREAERIKSMEEYSERLQRVYNADPHLRSLGDMFKDVGFDSLDVNLGSNSFWEAEGELVGWCLNYKPGNKGFALMGDVGLGKTTLAACVRNTLLWQGTPCVVATGSQIDEDLTSGFVSDSMSYQTYKNVDVLIIDDLGADIEQKELRKSRSYNASLFEVINSRYVNGKTTCYTSNMTCDELIQMGLDKRYIDRLAQMIGNKYNIVGQSVRQVI